MSNEYGNVRASIDVDSLTVYLTANIAGFKGPLQVKQFKFGQSNPTYFLADANGKRYVLRKKPSGELISKTAHQVEREFTILDALHKHNTAPSTPVHEIVPIPEPYILCKDTAVIGTPFYVMEFLDGRIFTDVTMPGIAREAQRECWLSAVRSLASLAILNPDDLGLSKFGPHTDYFPRQIKSLSKVSKDQAVVTDIDTGRAVGDIPRFNSLIEWYRTHLPDERKTGLKIVHGDYKLDNLVFHRTENRVIGILDWELCTLGSPLADLANLTQPWAVGGPKVPSDFPIIPFKNPSLAPLTLAELEQAYCSITKWAYPITEMPFARSWMMFRLSVIAQGIAARYSKRQASSEKAPLYQKYFPMFGHLAWQILEEEGLLAKL